MKEVRTLNRKFDARCRICRAAVYQLWVTDEPPPAGCCEGRDQEPWRCGTVYTRLVSIVIKLDHMDGTLTPDQEYLLKLLGPKAEQIMTDIRAQKWPPRYTSEPKEPDYSTSRTAH